MSIQTKVLDAILDRFPAHLTMHRGFFLVLLSGKVLSFSTGKQLSYFSSRKIQHLRMLSLLPWEG